MVSDVNEASLRDMVAAARAVSMPEHEPTVQYLMVQAFDRGARIGEDLVHNGGNGISIEQKQDLSAADDLRAPPLPIPDPAPDTWVHGTRLGRAHRSVRIHLAEDHGKVVDAYVIELGMLDDWSDAQVHGVHDGVHHKVWAYAHHLPHFERGSQSTSGPAVIKARVMSGDAEWKWMYYTGHAEQWSPRRDNARVYPSMRQAGITSRRLQRDGKLLYAEMAAEPAALPPDHVPAQLGDPVHKHDPFSNIPGSGGDDPC